MENQELTQPNPTPNSTAQTGLSSQGQPLQDISNSKLKWVLIILGILEIPLSAFLLFVTLSNLIYLNINIGANPLDSYFGIGFFAVLLLIALAQLLVGLLSLESRFGEIKTKVLIAFGIILSILAIPVIPTF